MKNKRVLTRIGRTQGVGGDPGGGVSQKGKGLGPSLFPILGSLCLLTTILFIVWSWIHLTRGEGKEASGNRNPIVSVSDSHYKTSQGIMNDIQLDFNECDALFTERKEYTRKSCQAIHDGSSRYQPGSTNRSIQGILPRRIPALGKSSGGRNRRNWIFIETPGKRPISIQWCPIYKAASSPWMAAFAKLASILTPHTEEMIRKGKLTFIKLFKDFRLNIPSAPKEDAGRGGRSRNVKMLIVRHPFDRLLSAYRDKLERVQGREFYYRKYGYRILSQFRYSNQFNTMRKDSGRNTIDTFHSMLSKILELRNAVRSNGRSDGRENGTNSTFAKGSDGIRQEVPTFYEFVQYLLSADVRSMDEHWRPMHLDCNPCQYPFDLILKVETMERDREVLFNLLGFGPRQHSDGSLTNPQVEEINKIFNRWTNKGTPYRNNTKTKEDEGKGARRLGHPHPIGENYFSQVPKSDLKLLYLKYEMDFLLFNYTPTHYFEMGK